MEPVEKAKWDAYYETAGSAALPVEVEQFGRELRHWFEELLNGRGGSVLEAGCGAGWQSVAIAENLQFDVHLMDFSDKALNAARKVFQQRGVAATFEIGDAFDSGSADFDLVFNAGVIEHYSFEDQVRLVRAMASRSRGLVAVVAPNPACYWYWISRLRHAQAANWPFGLETPVTSLRAVFEGADVEPLEERFLGRDWTERLIRGLPEVAPSLADMVTHLHSAGVVEDRQACYLVGVAGAVRTASLPVAVPNRAGFIEDSLRSVAADALAIRLAGDARVAEMTRRTKTLEHELEVARAASQKPRAIPEQKAPALRRRLQQYRDGARAYNAQFEAALVELRSQRAWQLMLVVRKAYDLWMRHGWPGRVQALKLLATAPFGAAAVVNDQEPVWPRLESYLPVAKRPDAAGDQDGISLARKYDVVILAIIDFDFRYQRPQHIAAQFAARGHRVLWVSPTRFLPRESGRSYLLRELQDNVWEVQLRGRQPDIYLGELGTDDVQQLAAGLAALYRDLAISENALIVQLPFWRKLAAELHSMQHALVTYDCMDEWGAFENMGAFNRTEEKALVRECDVLFASAQRLADKFRSAGLSPVLVRNAVDYEFFANSQEADLLPGIMRPVIGYFGAIADWIDLDLIERAARERPGYSFVLIGQVFGRDISSLEELPNVHLLGNQPYQRIPQYLRQFDVCIIPFLINDVTAATDPVKLYEYLSLGKPVVATDMAELRPYGDLIYIAAEPSLFSARVDEALGEHDSDRAARRIEFARTNTWRSRAAVMDESIAAQFPRISVIIVTHNSERYIEPCLDSLWRNACYPAVEVIVFDNASTDHTRDILVSQAPRWPGLICEFSDRNLGFAGGNNTALARSTGDYIAFLNADTMVTPGWLGRLLAHLRGNPHAGLVCAVTNFAGNEVKIATSYANVESMENFAVDVAARNRGLRTPVRTAPLFCALIERQLLKRLGGLDERYEVGMFEDDDLAASVRAQGLEVIMAEDCFVHHFGQGSFGALPTPEYTRVFEENRARYEQKWRTKWKVHTLRPGVLPPDQDVRFDPDSFTLPGD